jgi:hypothetical protein
VGDLAPWRAGPSEQAAVGAESPMRSARDRARWAATSARSRGGRGRSQGWELGRARVGPGREEGALGRAGGGGGGGETGPGGGRPNGPGKGRGLIPFLFFFIYFY